MLICKGNDNAIEVNVKLGESSKSPPVKKMQISSLVGK
jgi:hypothetical protein